jgi:hypothetical protein
MAWLAEVPREYQWPYEEGTRKAWVRASADRLWPEREIKQLEIKLDRARARGGSYRRARAVAIAGRLARYRRELAHRGAVARAQAGNIVAQRRLEWQALVIWRRRAIVEAWTWPENCARRIASAEHRLAEQLFVAGDRQGQPHTPQYRKALERSLRDERATYTSAIIKLQAIVDVPVPTYRDWAAQAVRVRGHLRVLIGGKREA